MLPWSGHTHCTALLMSCALLLLLLRMPSTAAHPYQGRLSDPKCSDPETGRELYVGEAFTRPGRCVRVQCLGSLQIWEDSCQTPQLQGNCSALPPADKFLDYPKCCPMYECKTYEANENGQSEETRTYDQYGTLRKTHITQLFVITDPIKGTIPGHGVKTQFEI